MAQDFRTLNNSTLVSSVDDEVNATADTLRSSFSGETFPSSPVEGQLFFRTSDDSFFVRSDTDWIEINKGVTPISMGGTGAMTAGDARSNLGLGVVSADNVVPVSRGGTGATSASGARSALELRPFTSGTSAIPINAGGTGATTTGSARTNLGLGDVAEDDVVPLIRGGTGATTPTAARAALGVNSTAQTQGLIDAALTGIVPWDGFEGPVSTTEPSGNSINFESFGDLNVNLRNKSYVHLIVSVGQWTDTRSITITGIVQVFSRGGMRGLNRRDTNITILLDGLQVLYYGLGVATLILPDPSVLPTGSASVEGSSLGFEALYALWKD